MVLRYIEGNPVRAKMVQSTMEWRWSSHDELVGNGNRNLIDKVPIDLPGGWTAYVDASMGEGDLDRVRSSVNRQTPLGDAGWLMKICNEFGLESTIRRRGRPKKEINA